MYAGLSSGSREYGFKSVTGPYHAVWNDVKICKKKFDIVEYGELFI